MVYTDKLKRLRDKSGD